MYSIFLIFLGVCLAREASRTQHSKKYRHTRLVIFKIQRQRVNSYAHGAGGLRRPACDRRAEVIVFSGTSVNQAGKNYHLIYIFTFFNIYKAHTLGVFFFCRREERVQRPCTDRRNRKHGSHSSGSRWRILHFERCGSRSSSQGDGGDQRSLEGDYCTSRVLQPGHRLSGRQPLRHPRR